MVPLELFLEIILQFEMNVFVNTQIINITPTTERVHM